MLVPVILAGGSGSRLWPLSRSAYPKQLLPLVSGKTMLQETILRTISIPDMQSPIVICNQEHRFLVAEQLKEIGIDNATIILEPVGKGTAPAAALAALYARQLGNDPTLFILPADHVIADNEFFKSAVNAAVENAEQGLLVTFGIKPTSPEIGYGYIKTAATANYQQGYPIHEFIEKPHLEKAKSYLKSGQYYWNSGMFMFQASQVLNELAQYAPEILAACQNTLANMTKDLDFVRLDQTIFDQCPINSIDYALMEKTKNAVLIPLSTFWSDVGSWSALWDAKETDAEGNIFQGDVLADQVTNSYVRAESRMLAVVGVSDHIIVETKDAVLVAHKDKSQAVKNIVEQLKKQQRSEADTHRRVYRPWGHYETIDHSDGFQVKRITVKPGASLSLQMHHHRAEHWVVVNGIAEVTCGENVFTVKANESTYIPKGVKHRLVNRGETELQLIEVQSGSYLGEDDIVRFDDVYGRVQV